MGRIIDVLRLSTPNSFPIIYGDPFTLWDSTGNPIPRLKGDHIFCYGRSWPNWITPDGKSYDLKYGILDNGNFQTMVLFDKVENHGKCFVFNPVKVLKGKGVFTDGTDEYVGGEVPALMPNWNHKNAAGEPRMICNSLMCHKAYSATWPGSAACITVPEKDEIGNPWDDLISFFQIGEAVVFRVFGRT